MTFYSISYLNFSSSIFKYGCRHDARLNQADLSIYIIIHNRILIAAKCINIQIFITSDDQKIESCCPLFRINLLYQNKMKTLMYMYMYINFLIKQKPLSIQYNNKMQNLFSSLYTKGKKYIIYFVAKLVFYVIKKMFTSCRFDKNFPYIFLINQMTSGWKVNTSTVAKINMIDIYIIFPKRKQEAHGPHCAP